MNFGLTQEQDLLRHQASKFLDEQCPMQEVRRVMAEPAGFSRNHWKALAGLGWTGLITPDHYGGAGLGWIDLIVVLEEVGRGLFPSPLISSLLASSAIDDAGSAAQKERWLVPLATGDEIGTLALFDDASDPSPGAIATRGRRDGDGFIVDGHKRHVADAQNATLFIVAFRDEADALHLAVVSRDNVGVSVEARETLDLTKRTGHLELANVRIADDALIEASADPATAIARSLDRAAIAVSAEILGAAQAAHTLTVQYAKDRVQFGSPIGRYQGVKHPLAEMYVDLESLRSLLYYAAWALEQSPDEVPLAASRTKAFATEAFMNIGIGAIQLHGAVGYTEEYDVQLYLKRSKWARPAYGDEAHHLERVAKLGGL
ncbi:MAG: acyl-CoA/acyl-ACP dehydrogenase [bacterium]|nr:acyl-CoA/acyl-ACP dehydrogenase [bacterium]